MATAVTNTELGNDTDETPLHTRVRRLGEGSAALSEHQRRRLDNFAAALENGRDAATWASVDLARVLDSEALVRGRAPDPSPPGWLRGLELLRNLLVLAPVGWTWYGISLASNAYQETLTADPTLGPLPFLLLWQRGFAGRLAWLPFNRMALIDSGLVALIILLTIALHFFDDRADAGAAAANANARQEVDDLLADATLELAEHNGGQQRRFLAEFAERGDRLLREIGEERARLERLATQRERELTALTAFADGLVHGATMLLEAGHNFGRMYQQVTEAMQKLSGAVGRQAAGQDTLLQHAGAIADSLRTWTSVASQQTEALRLALTGATDATTQIGNAAQSIRANVDRLAAEFPPLVRVIGDGVAPLPGAVSVIGAAAQNVADAVTVLNAAVEQSVETQRRVAGAETAVSERLADVLHEQQRIGATLRDTADSVGKVGGTLASSADALTLATRTAQEHAADQTTRADAATSAAEQRIRDLLRETQRLLDLATQTISRHDATNRHMASTLEEFFAGLERDRMANQATAEHVAEAAIKAAMAMTAINDRSATLNGLAVNLDELARGLPAYVQQMRGEFNEVALSQQSAAQQLAAVGLSAEQGAQAVGVLIERLLPQVERLAVAVSAQTGGPNSGAAGPADGATQSHR